MEQGWEKGDTLDEKSGFLPKEKCLDYVQAHTTNIFKKRIKKRSAE